VFAQSAWAQIATAVAGTTGEGAAVASVLSVGVGSASHFGSELDSLGRWSGLCSLGRRTFSKPMGTRAKDVRALL
jgi:hypothetical protein